MTEIGPFIEPKFGQWFVSGQIFLVSMCILHVKTAMAKSKAHFQDSQVASIYIWQVLVNCHVHQDAHLKNREWHHFLRLPRVF